MLSSKDGFIEWKLPIKYYVDVVPQGTYVDGDFFVLRFNKSAYLMALKNAKKQAQALLRQSVAEGAHLLLTQSGYPLSGYHLKALPRLVGSEVSRYRSHAQAFTAEQLGRMALYGPTWDSAFVLTMANGVRLKAGLVSLFQSVIYAPDDSSAIEESRVIPLVTLAEKGPYELLEYLKTADNFEEWSSAFIPDGPTPEGFNLGSSLAKALKTGTPSIEAL